VSTDALAATAEGVVLEDSTRRRLLASWLRPAAFSDVQATLDVLARHPHVGGRLGILSNGSPRMIATVLEHTGLAHRFAWVLSVDSVGIFKPAPKVYDLAVQASGVRPERILFVSSNDWDIAGATAIGFRTCWVNRIGASPERLGQGPSQVVSTLDEIVALVD
jgi:2-haloacid dehalogenase